MNSSGNTTSVEADPYFLLRARMIFERATLELDATNLT